MKQPFIFILTVFVASMIVFAPISSLGRNISTDSQRWDIQMGKEARIWQNLLTNYYYADHQRYWPRRKAALEKIVNEFAQSRWADDAALILACGKASFENDSEGAIAALEEVIRRYPDGQTVVAHWFPDDGCRFDNTWLMWQGGLVFLNPDGTVRVAKPFSRGGMSQLEKECLAYFGHLEKYPVATKVMAQLFKSQILGHKGHTAEAIATLEAITSNSGTYLATLNRADKRAASRADGHYIRSAIKRPECQAYLSLIGYYEKAGDVEKAVGKAGELLNIYSKDGWQWTINRHIGNFYDRLGFRGQAKEQYRLALDGLMVYKDLTEKREKLIEGSDIPDNFWENSRSELEAKLTDKPQQKPKEQPRTVK